MSAGQSSAGVPRADGAWPWVVAVLGWLYYLTPFVQRVVNPDIGFEPWLFLQVAGFGALAIVALTRREANPVGVACACAVLWAGSPAVLGAAAVAQESLARQRGPDRTVFAVGSAMLGFKALGFLGSPSGGSATAIQFEFILAAAAVMAGTLVGLLRRSGAQAVEARERAERSRREAELALVAEARLAERELIAREMHDAIAHRLSLVAMHAGALAYRTRIPPEETREAARLIQTNAQASLDELRAMLTTLRSPDASPEAPQPTLDQVGVLTAEAADADQRVALSVSGDLYLVPARVSRHAFRIVQESLTNARKHAPGAPVTVALAHADGVLRMRIVNPLSTLAQADASGARLGLVGIDERVALLDGRVTHGVRDKAFVVEATLPITARTGHPLPADHTKERTA